MDHNPKISLSFQLKLCSLAARLEGISKNLWKLADQTESAEAELYAQCLRVLAEHGSPEDIVDFYRQLIAPEHVDEITLRTIQSLRSLLHGNSEEA